MAEWAGRSFEEHRTADQEEHRTDGVEGHHIRVAVVEERRIAAAAAVHTRLGAEGRRTGQAAAVDSHPAGVQVSHTDSAGVLHNPAARQEVVLPTDPGLAGVEVHHTVVDSPAVEEDSCPAAAGHPNPVAEVAHYIHTGPVAGAPGSILPDGAAAVRTSECAMWWVFVDKRGCSDGCLLQG